MKPFIHDRTDFKDLISALGASLNILDELIEKDYWLMHALWGLRELNLAYELKGGTSLFKGWGCINRFSEDIDILIKTDGIDEVPKGKNQTKAPQVEKRKKYFESIFEKIKIPGFTSAARDPNFDDEHFRNIGIRLYYPKLYGSIEGLKDGILLEIGFDQTTPNYEKLISSWVLDKAAETEIMKDIKDNRINKVKCYAPEYTFVEKLQAISTKFRQQQEKQDMPSNFLRHYYDVSQLLKLERVQNFIGTEAYIAHKKKRFKEKDEQDLTKNEAFIISDSDVRQKYNKAFLISKDLYYKGQPSFDGFLTDIKPWLEKL